ncbi:hypothetical protein ACVWWG_000197 [Bradyrhizobium sp. LB7.2]
MVSSVTTSRPQWKPHSFNSSMSSKPMKVLEMDKLEAVADGGYFDGRDISPEGAGVAVTSPKPMTSNGTRRAVRQTGLCLPALMRTSTAAHPASSCLSLRTSSTRRRCTVTGRQQRAKVARSRDKILRQRSATSRAESKSMWSNWSRRSSIPIPTPCGHDARGGASLRHYQRLYGCDPIPDEGP